ncbi:hypothetical protein NQ315_001104 [Exocentrus adspersus]|uniref:C2H2-type domain-containing protein n=1 Tax=Exocentrus adspersus TaxID=1586481 RepID=A0AAV8WGR9_9CUCU|nr:hypothetical protein NQ315_001104 [Exocentrus adspersus]
MPTFECQVELCGYKAYQKVHLERHLHRIHNILTKKKGVSSYGCFKCGKKFKNKQSLTYHVNIDCGTSKSYKCVFCNYLSKRSFSIKKHCLRVHPTEDIRGRIFYIKLKDDNASEKRRWSTYSSNVCSTCGKRFKSKPTLSYHIKVDCMKKKSFKCVFCDFYNKRPYEIKKHCYIKHPDQDLTTGSNLWTGKKSVFPYGLENLLRSVPDGQIVLMKKQGLDNPSRQKLVKIVIDNLLSAPSNKFPSVLLGAAEEIVELFPGERMESYYIPYANNKQNKSHPKGKLYSRYINSKRALTIAKAENASEDKGSRKSKASTVTENEMVSYNALLEPTNRDLNETLNHWRNTFKIRMLKLLSFDSQLDYFRTFPCLSQPFGYKMLENDFYMKYPKAREVSIHKTWPAIALAVVDVLRGKQTQAPDLYSMNIGVATLSLRVLPWLFTPVCLRNRESKKAYKLARTEMAERFILHVANPEDLDARLEERKKKLLDFNVKLQPLIVVVGPLEHPQAHYVVLDRQSYSFNDILTTLDVTFKVFHAMNLPFPAESKAMWQTIDQLVYKVSAHFDPASSVVLTEIEQKLKK